HVLASLCRLAAAATANRQLERYGPERSLRRRALRAGRRRPASFLGERWPPSRPGGAVEMARLSRRQTVIPIPPRCPLAFPEVAEPRLGPPARCPGRIAAVTRRA